MLHGFPYCTIVLIFLHACITAGNQPHVTSTQNCYYTFVVPRDQDGGSASVSTTAEVIQLRHEVGELKSSVTNLQEQLALLSKLVREGEDFPVCPEEKPDNDGGHSGEGVHFSNWGTSQCPQNTSRIYHGFGAKALFESRGGGIDFQCLPSDPEWTGDEVTGNQANNYIHGVEYYAASLAKIIPSGEIFTGMPCSVCEVHHHHQQLMIPAKTSCPGGWVMQYTGYLMAERSGHISPSNYVCVNKEFEKLTGSTGNQPSGYVNPVEAVCGALPCPPYQQGYELSCVVCTK